MKARARFPKSHIHFDDECIPHHALEIYPVVHIDEPGHSWCLVLKVNEHTPDKDQDKIFIPIPTGEHSELFDFICAQVRLIDWKEECKEHEAEYLHLLLNTRECVAETVFATHAKIRIRNRTSDDFFAGLEVPPLDTPLGLVIEITIFKVTTMADLEHKDAIKFFNYLPNMYDMSEHENPEDYGYLPNMYDMFGTEDPE